MQRREGGIHFGDQCVVDGGRQVVAEQFPVQHRVVIARPGECDLVLQVRVQDRTDTIAILEPLAPEGIEYQLAIPAVFGGAVPAIPLRIDAAFFAGRQRHRRPRNVRVGDHAVNVERAGEGLGKIRERLLCLVAERMRRISQAVLELKPKSLQSLIFIEVGADDFFADAQDLRLHPGACLVESREHDLPELAPLLRASDAQILVGIQARISRNAGRFAARVGYQCQGGIQAVGAVAQRAAFRLDRFEAGQYFATGLFPGLDRRVNIGQVPGVPGVDRRRIFLREAGDGRNDEQQYA